ncbi:MAG: hypothetical protein NT038_09970, partial [Euryarchaeota archaeon]|nr:hypothetical protein [Euryarchaeota archaeon]
MDNRRLIKKSLVYGIIGILICTSIVPLIEYVRADGPGYEIAPGTLINRVPERILARTSDGVMHCVYYRSDGSHSQIYHSFSSDYGVTWTEEPVTSGNYDQQYPAIAVDSQDALHVVWAGYHSGSPTVLQIRYCKRISSDWQTIENLTNEPYPQDETSAIAIDGNDAVHVVWSGIAGPDPAWPHVRYRKYTTSWGPINELQEAVGYSGLCAAIAIDNNNYVHVVWESGGYHHQSSYHLVYQRYTTYWEPYEPISITDNNPVGRACIAVESNGDVHLIGNTWEGIAHKEKTSAGWQNADLLESSYTLLSSISIDSHEYLHVVWQYNGNIKYRKYTTSWQPTETIISD